VNKPDSLNAVLDTPFREPLNKFLDEFMGRNVKVFLIGAGYSKCADLPLMKELIQKVRSTI